MFSNVSIIFVLKYFSVICANTLLLLGRKADDGWKITFITQFFKAFLTLFQQYNNIKLGQDNHTKSYHSYSTPNAKN